MRVLYRISADIIVLLHLLWIIFLILGAFIGKQYKGVKIIHISGLGFAIIMQVFGWYCPLTYLEVWLRQMYDQSKGYSGSFIINYVQKLVYIDLSGKIILTATILLILMSMWIYMYKPKKRGEDT